MGVFEFMAKGVGTVLLSATGVASLLIEAMAESGGLEDIATLANQGKEKSFQAVQGFWREKPNVELTEEQFERSREFSEDSDRRKRLERIEREMNNLKLLMRKAKERNDERLMEMYELRVERLEEIKESLMDTE